MRKVLLVAAVAAVAGSLAVAQQTPAAPAAPAQKQRAVKSTAEAQALQGVFNAPTADARITAAEDFISKYANSDFRGLVFYAEAQSYAMKNDYEKTVVYAEKTLEADPDPASKVQAMLLLAREIAQKTREFDLDREEKLGRVEKYANGALEELKTMQKPNPQLPDDQWAEAKATMEADAHDALGIDSLVRKNYDQAIKEFKTALGATKTPDPAVELRLASTYNRAQKYDDAIALCEKIAAEPNTNATVKQYAQAERARALQAKGGGQKPATPAAGAAGNAPAPAPAPTPAPTPKP